MSLVAGMLVLGMVAPVRCKTAMATAERLTAAAHKKVDCCSAPPGPSRSSMFLYPMSSASEKGDTKAMAKGKAAAKPNERKDEMTEAEDKRMDRMSLN